MNSTWLNTSKLANQRAWKALFKQWYWLIQLRSISLRSTVINNHYLMEIIYPISVNESMKRLIKSTGSFSKRHRICGYIWEVPFCVKFTSLEDWFNLNINILLSFKEEEINKVLRRRIHFHSLFEPWLKHNSLNNISWAKHLLPHKVRI